MNAIVEKKKTQLTEYLAIMMSQPIQRPTILPKVLSTLDVLLKKEEGLQTIYDKAEQLVAAGVFAGTSWQDPQKLVPALVAGTLRGGYPMVIYESVSEIRMLKIALGDWQGEEMDEKEAMTFLQEAIISAFHLIFQDKSEESRVTLSAKLRKRIQLLFQFILQRIPLNSIKTKLAHEVKVIAAQRPIITSPIREILKLVREHVELQPDGEADEQLRFFINALFHPSSKSQELQTQKAYQEALAEFDEATLQLEAEQMGRHMRDSGLVSPMQVSLLKYLAKTEQLELLGKALALGPHGMADLQRHHKIVYKCIDEYLLHSHRQVAYGLSRTLERNLFSRKAVLNGLRKLFTLRVHSEVANRLHKSRPDIEKTTPLQLVCGGVLRVLGQPLGLSQGLNPTCQSARGLSMWSRHSPEKFLNLLINAVAANELHFRYEGDLVISRGVYNEQTFDFELDPVSVVMVPLLDDIYNQMMQKAAIKHPGEDPHVSVNPAFYGHWIQTGFISCYNALRNVIENYEEFVRLFYTSYHPQYNGGHKLIYPIPLGIFITSSHAEFLGYHAISLLRVKQNEAGAWRAYFYNPNNEGRQNWGQGICPTVYGHGEKHGESSLPFDEFVSRIYAYHYNSIEAESRDELKLVPNDEVARIEQLAQESWGKQYFWE